MIDHQWPRGEESWLYLQKGGPTSLHHIKKRAVIRGACQCVSFGQQLPLTWPSTKFPESVNKKFQKGVSLPGEEVREKRNKFLGFFLTLAWL